jgi:hypothetical protein
LQAVIGDESFGFAVSVRQGAKVVTGYSLSWRSGPVTALLLLLRDSGAHLRLATAVTLAQKQEQRIHS